MGVLACAAGYVLLEDIVSVKTLSTAMAFVGPEKGNLSLSNLIDLLIIGKIIVPGLTIVRAENFHSRQISQIFYLLDSVVSP